LWRQLWKRSLLDYLPAIIRTLHLELLPITHRLLQLILDPSRSLRI